MTPLRRDALAPTVAFFVILSLLALGCSSPTASTSTSTPLAIGADGAADDEETLPAFVAAAVLAALPGARLLAASREVDEGGAGYEVLAETADGTFEVDLDPEGTVLEIEPAADDERPISVADLPAAVLAAAQATVPGGRITQAMRQSVRGEVVYDIEVDVRGRKFDLEISAAGEVLDVDEAN